MIKCNGDVLYECFKLVQVVFFSFNDCIQESFISICMIKVFGLEDCQLVLFVVDVEDIGKKNMWVVCIDVCFDLIIYIVIGMVNLLVIGGGSWMVVQGSLMLGQFISFMMYLGLMIWLMLVLVWMFNIVECGSVVYSCICVMLVEVLVVNDGSEFVLEGCGEFDVNIYQFMYLQIDYFVLENVNFVLKFGQMLGICGLIGFGKSILLLFIQCYFDVSEGDICFYDIFLMKL